MKRHVLMTQASRGAPGQPIRRRAATGPHHGLLPLYSLSSSLGLSLWSGCLCLFLFTGYSTIDPSHLYAATTPLLQSGIIVLLVRRNSILLSAFTPEKELKKIHKNNPLSLPLPTTLSLPLFHSLIIHTTAKIRKIKTKPRINYTLLILSL